MKKKAQLVIDLLKEYFRNKDIDCYNVLCIYNSDMHLKISDSPLIEGEFYFIIGNEKVILDITPTGILKVNCDKPMDLLEVLEVVNFYELCGSCASENDNGSWDKTINYLKREVGIS